jgi:hypothetical protein
LCCTGHIQTIAGNGNYSVVAPVDGVGTNAEFSYPRGRVISTANLLYVADHYGYRIRTISSGSCKYCGSISLSHLHLLPIIDLFPLGLVSTLAGSGSQGSQDGYGTMASFMSPFELVLSTSGVLYVSEGSSNDIRSINVNNGTMQLLI